MEEGLPEASRCGNEQNAREESCGDQTDLVKTYWNETEINQQVIRMNVGSDISGAGCLSPLRIKEVEDSSKEKKNGPNLKSSDRLKSMRPEEEKDLSCVDQTQPLCLDCGLTQGAKRKFKKMARDKGKVQETEKAEKAQEVSNKRKVYNDTLFISKGNVQKRLCVGEQERGVNYFAETAVLLILL